MKGRYTCKFNAGCPVLKDSQLLANKKNKLFNDAVKVHTRAQPDELSSDVSLGDESI